MEAVEARMKELAFWIDFGLNRACQHAVDKAEQGKVIEELQAKIKELEEPKTEN